MAHILPKRVGPQGFPAIFNSTHWLHRRASVRKIKHLPGGIPVPPRPANLCIFAKFGIAQYFILDRLSYRAKRGAQAATVVLALSIPNFFQFQKEKEMSNYDYDDDELASFSGRLDQGAEVFTKKMFRHSQAKAQEDWSDLKKNRQTKKMFAIRSRSRRADSGV